MTRLLELPGRRLFQCREADSRAAGAGAEVNAFLQEIAGRRISLKDFRTLVASAAALKALAATEPADSERQRRRQVREAVVEIAEELANTPTVCRTSYVHDSVIAAFEAGALKRPRIRKAKSPATQAELLARIVSRHVDRGVRPTISRHRSSELGRRAGSARLLLYLSQASGSRPERAAAAPLRRDGSAPSSAPVWARHRSPAAARSAARSSRKVTQPCRRSPG